VDFIHVPERLFMIKPEEDDPRGTVPAQPSNGFLNTHPDPFISRKKRCFLRSTLVTVFWELMS